MEKKTQEQPKPEAQKQNQDQPNPETQEKAVKEPKPKKAKSNENRVDAGTYDSYCELKFAAISYENAGNASFGLTKEQQKTLSDLENAVLKCDGPKASRTVTAAIGHEKIRLVKGVPIPEYVEKLIKDSDTAGYYLL